VRGQSKVRGCNVFLAVGLRLTLISAAIFLVSCPGQVSPNPYSCGTPSGGHCYSIALTALGRANAGSCTADNSSAIFGYRSSIGVVTNGMTPGNLFFNNEMWLKSHTGPGWIEAGYMDDAFLGELYFWAENDNSTGIYVNHFLSNIPQSDFGNNALVQIFNNGPDRNTSSSFTVSIQNVSTNFQTTTNNPLWNSPPTPWAAEINFGQELAGTNGASASAVFFLNNSWMDSNGVWRLQTLDMASQVDQPPFGGWVQTPCDTAQSGQPQGGAFVTYCCVKQ
jgi:hypothetical protein